jgi:prevent-host-death family protein
MTQRTVTLHEAETHLSRLVEEVEAGQEIVIARAGRPVARLVGVRARTAPRKPGLWRGRVRLAPDFDTLDEELIASFAK